MECCNQNVETPFCPECGKAIDRKPMSTLLWHIQRHVRLNERTLSKPEQYEGDHKSCRKALKKWSEWAAGLQKMMKKIRINEDPGL